MKHRIVWLVALLLLWLFCSGAAQAGALQDRLAQFPNWQDKPPVETAKGDLVYPDWFAGEWQVTTTLLDMASPLAPDVVTPGFDSNRQYLNQPVLFRVRFVDQAALDDRPKFSRQAMQAIQTMRRAAPETKLVSDRAYNGLNLARAYLGDRPVIAVKVDPNNPNRQITLLRGNRQLVSIVTGRATEAPSPQAFATTEVFQQMFRGTSQPYLNEVETTTAYQHQPDHEHPITADQVTAIYLSPQDPDYFAAGDSPVALYRYRLDFRPVSPQP